MKPDPFVPSDHCGTMTLHATLIDPVHGQMPLIRFTDNIQRHTACPEETVPGETLREALDAYFAKHADARPYVLDDQGGLRKHMVIFIDGVHLRDRAQLTDAVKSGGTIDVMQALSGG